MSTTYRWTHAGVLGALGATLFVAESLVPHPLPMTRLGLGNLAVIVGLSLGGVGLALIVAMLKVGLGSLATGMFLSPVMILGVAGSLLAVASMSFLKYLAGDRVSCVGLSVAGASAHVTVQVALVVWVIAQTGAVWRWLPIMLASGLVTGCIIGLVANMVLARLARGGRGVQAL